MKTEMTGKEDRAGRDTAGLDTLCKGKEDQRKDYVQVNTQRPHESPRPSEMYRLKDTSIIEFHGGSLHTSIGAVVKHRFKSDPFEPLFMHGMIVKF